MISNVVIIYGIFLALIGVAFSCVWVCGRVGVLIAGFWR